MCQFFCSQFHDLRKVLNHWKYEHQCQRQYLGYHRRVRLQTQHFSKGRRKHSIWHRRKYQQTESLGPSLDAVRENVHCKCLLKAIWNDGLNCSCLWRPILYLSKTLVGVFRLFLISTRMFNSIQFLLNWSIAVFYLLGDSWRSAKCDNKHFDNCEFPLSSDSAKRKRASSQVSIYPSLELFMTKTAIQIKYDFGPHLIHRRW